MDSKNFREWEKDSEQIIKEWEDEANRLAESLDLHEESINLINVEL